MSIPVSMAGKRLTVRLKTQAEADRWHTAASDLKFSTMNQFIRTLFTNSIKDQENKQEEIEQRNRERIEELEHEIDLFHNVLRGLQEPLGFHGNDMSLL